MRSPRPSSHEQWRDTSRCPLQVRSLECLALRFVCWAVAGAMRSHDDRRLAVRAAEEGTMEDASIAAI